IEHVEDVEGNPIKLKSFVQHESGVNGYVERFMVGDDKNILVKVNWTQDPDAKKLDSIVEPKTLLVVTKNIMEINEEAYEASRYMFFSNLEQVRRQAGLLLDLDEDKINEILENGHDWAQDHIATAKESIDQVFDFLMNETNGGDTIHSVDAGEEIEDEIGGDFEEEIEEGAGHSHTIGKGENKKPINYPEELMREAINEAIEEAFEKLISTTSTNSNRVNTSSDRYAQEVEKNLGQGVKFSDIVTAVKNVLGKKGNVKGELEKLKMKNWKGTPEGWHEFITNKKYFSATNESIEEDFDKTDYGFNKAMLDFETQEDFNKEVYYVLDNDFNQKHYPDLIGKTFDTPPSYAKVKVVKQGEIEEGSSNSLLNKHGKNAKPHSEKLKEGKAIENGDRYEQVIFLQDNEADHALNILMQDGEDEAMDYLMKWHQPGNHETSKETGFGSSDKTYERDGYIMAWNPTIGYISLVHDLEPSKIEEDSQRKRHTAGQIGKVSKNVPLGQNAPHSDSAEGL
ncbi:MAG: hypothetical protein EBS34_12455, partial [Flavobacteriales bacterium]|nr:hypothetical protein [Flavobacteriales bacterium]